MNVVVFTAQSNIFWTFNIFHVSKCKRLYLRHFIIEYLKMTKPTIVLTPVRIIIRANAAFVSDDELEGVEYVLVTHEVGSP